MVTLPRLAEALSTEWQEHGACRETDAAVFFPPPTFERKADREAREEKAKAVCAACPVRVPCLEWALSVEEPFGVWGGHSEAERRQILFGERDAS